MYNNTIEEYFKNRIPISSDPELDYFLSHTRHNLRFFIKSITSNSSSIFTFFGDTAKGLYYISDNLKECLRLEHNMVENLLDILVDYIYSDKYKEEYLADIADILKTGKPLNSRYPLKDSNDIYWIQLSLEALRDELDNTIFVAGRIIKENLSLELSPLTKLPLLNTFRGRLMLYKKYHTPCLVLGVNLRHINKINLEYGRQRGDLIIKDVVDNCLNKLITKMTSYSISGTKYVSIVEFDHEEEIKPIIREVAFIVDKVYKKYGIEVDRPVSFVVMKFYGDKIDTDDFIENLDSLMRASKNDIAGNYIDNSELYIDKIHEDAKMSLALNRDITNKMNGFSLNIQPIINASNQSIIGGECLLRWSYLNKPIPPMVFIPIIEANSLIHLVTRWVIEEAIRLLEDIIATKPDFYLTVNISKLELEDESFFSFIRETLDKAQIRPKNIVFEITENVMEGNSKNLARFIELCEELKIRIAIDDFGTGYSNLFSFLKYKYDILKIDRTVLLELEKSRRNLELVKALLGSCRKNKVSICLEGVETENQKEISKILEADYIQGYYYYRPMAVSDFLNLIK